MVRAMVHSRKHYAPMSLSTTVGEDITNRNIVIVTQSPALDDPTQVEPGTTIKAVHVEIWVLGSAQNIASFLVTLEKLESGADSMSFANSANLHQYNNKKNILYTTQGIVGENDANPVPLLRQWIAIPKGKQRFALGDKLVLNISNFSNDINFCGMFIFKSYN